MTQLSSLGAINKITGLYVYPKIANKKDEYICPECNKNVFPRQGQILRHHFAHKRSDNPCNYYNHPGETQIHKDAKMLMKYLLDTKVPLSFVRNCMSCNKNNIFDIPEITENSSIQLEHRFEYNDSVKIADVAYIDDKVIKYIFEICNTHKTCSENRPDYIDWFEIDAETLINMINDIKITSFEIPCIRCEKCEECIKKETDYPEIAMELNNYIKNKYNIDINWIAKPFDEKIRNDVRHKSSENESDSYCCLSKPIMEMLIDIICGDDAYEQWAGIYREMYLKSSVKDDIWEYAKSDMEKNIKIGYDNCNKCCDTYYNDDLIRDIQNLHLYKYLKELYVWHGQPRFIFGWYVSQIDTDDIEHKLKKLCEDLFGCNNVDNGYDTTVTWELND
jgi:hypothetical protein